MAPPYEANIMHMAPLAPQRSLHLLRLPSEVHALICSQICLHCTTSDDISDYATLQNDGQLTLLTLSKTCRAFRHVAQRFAFHAFINMPWKFQPKACSNFIRTLSDRPDLANQVKALHLGRGFTFRRIGSRDSLDGSLLPIARRLGMQTEIDPHFRSLWSEVVALDRFRIEIILALISKKLEALHICVEDAGEYSETKFNWLTQRRAYLGTPPTDFHHLRSLSIDAALSRHSKTFFFTNMAVRVMMQMAPNLERLTLNFCRGGDPRKYLVVENMPHLRNLVLVECPLEDAPPPGSFLHRLVTCAPKLEQFSYFLHPIWDVGSGRRYLPPRSILECLEPAQKSLKHIDIDLHGRTKEDGDILIDGGALAVFTELEILKLHGSAFCRHCEGPGATAPGEATCLINIIPKKAKGLLISVSAVTPVFDEFSALAAVCSARFPTLKQIHIYVIRSHPMRDLAGFDPYYHERFEKGMNNIRMRLQNHFRNTNVNFELTTQYGLPWTT